MPLWVAALVGGLVQVAGTLVGRILLSLGIGYVTFSGLDMSLDWLKGEVLGRLNGLPAVSLQVAGVLQVGTCISILVSSLTARLILNGLTGGSITRMVTKG